jgi:hypothetical protein
MRNWGFQSFLIVLILFVGIGGIIGLIAICVYYPMFEKAIAGVSTFLLVWFAVYIMGKK